jgi:DNA-binding LacI/PurR family transcriptional regulator
VHIPPDIPLYAFIKRELKNKIESGELPEGERVPSELELARQYDVSRNPTRQALRDLELEGYITRSPGRGSFVAPTSQRQKILGTDEWRAVSIACPELECRYTRTVVQGFIQNSAARGFHPMVNFMRFDEEGEYEFLADIRNSGIEGIACWLQHATARTLDLVRQFTRSGFPVVLIDRYVRELDTDFVVTDNEDLGYRLTKALLDRGHQDIAFASSKLDNTATQDRFTGYRQALEQAGISFNEELVGTFAPDGEAVEAVVSRIMAFRRRPTAFCCTNDGAASKLLDQFFDLGYTVPDDIELALVDDNDFADAMGIPMITGSQAGEEMGRESAALLAARIEEPRRAAEQRFLRATVSGELQKKGGDSESDTKEAAVGK